MLRFSLNIKACCLYVIWESKIKFGQKCFASPKISPVHSRTPVLPDVYQVLYEAVSATDLGAIPCSNLSSTLSMKLCLSLLIFLSYLKLNRASIHLTLLTEATLSLFAKY